MQRVMLKSKIYRATVSDCDLRYAQYDEAELSTYEPRVVHVAAGRNQIIDVDAEVATLLA